MKFSVKLYELCGMLQLLSMTSQGGVDGPAAGPALDGYAHLLGDNNVV